MALLENCIGRGLLADRPAPGAPGAVYFTSDTSEGFRDNGTDWDRITTVGASTEIYDATGSVLVLWPGHPITVAIGD